MILNAERTHGYDEFRVLAHLQTELRLVYLGLLKDGRIRDKRMVPRSVVVSVGKT